MPAPNPPVAGGRGGKAGVLVAAEGRQTADEARESWCSESLMRCGER